MEVQSTGGETVDDVTNQNGIFIRYMNTTGSKVKKGKI